MVTKCQATLDYLKEIFCNKPLLHFPDHNKDYLLYSNVSNNAYSGVLCQVQDNNNDIKPIVYFSGAFTAQNKSWCATEKEAYTVLRSGQRFDYYLRGVQCTLRCDHKPLKPFLSRAMKIAKLDRWAMLLQEYDIRFIHIKGIDNILADAISRLCTINIYEDPTKVKPQHSPKSQPESSKVTDEVQLLDAGNAQQLLNITTKTLRRLQKQDTYCKRKVHELKTGTHNEFYLNNENILKRKITVNNQKVSIIVIPTPLIYTLLHEFHNCKGHQGSARTFNLLKHKFWWKGMRLDVRNHINSCITCSKNLPNTACHPQLHLEIPKVPFACITKTPLVSYPQLPQEIDMH